MIWAPFPALHRFSLGLFLSLTERQMFDSLSLTERRSFGVRRGENVPVNPQVFDASHLLPQPSPVEGEGAKTQASTRIPQPRRDTVDGNVYAAFHALQTRVVRSALTVAAHQLHLQVVQRIKVREAVLN